MKTLNVYSRDEAEREGKYKVIFYLFLIAALLALMIMTEFGSKFL